jgi:hypothetical protein
LIRQVEMEKSEFIENALMDRLKRFETKERNHGIPYWPAPLKDKATGKVKRDSHTGLPEYPKESLSYLEWAYQTNEKGYFLYNVRPCPNLRDDGKVITDESQKWMILSDNHL